MGAEEREPPGGMELDQPGAGTAAGTACASTRTGSRNAGREEIQRCAVERDAAAGHDHVDVRMVRHRRAPGVEHGGDADTRTEMTRVGGDGEHRLRRRPEQQIVDHRLVLEGDVGDLGGHGEDDVEVADRQQVGLARGQPLARRGTLALGAVPVAAAVVGDTPWPQSSQPSTWPPSAAVRQVSIADITLSWVQAQVSGMGGTIGGPGSTEDIGDLERGSHRRFSRPGSLPSISSLRCSSGLVTARIVLVATRA